MLLSVLHLGLYVMKLLWGIVTFPINKLGGHLGLRIAWKNEKELEERCKELSKENERLKDQISELKESFSKRMDEMTKHMAHVMVRENKGGFESPSDVLNPTKIAKKLKMLYEDQALPIVGMFDDEEIKGVEFIAHMIQESFTFCRNKASEQISEFTCASHQAHCYKEEVPNSENGSIDLSQILKVTEINDLYLLRWKVAMSETFRNEIRKQFETIAMNKIDEGIKVKFQASQSKTILMNFMLDCADICWLVATCHPPLKMRFDVKENMYEGWIRQSFRKYTTRKAVAMTSHPKGFIVCVAWPALVSADGSLLHQKGEVITVD